MGRKRVGIDTAGAPYMLRFADGSTAEADIVIGADGAHSTLRSALFGTSPATYSGMCAFRAVVPAGQAPDFARRRPRRCGSGRTTTSSTTRSRRASWSTWLPSTAKEKDRMRIRRVVTGVDESGAGVVVDDGHPPRYHELTTIPGIATVTIWATGAGETIRVRGTDPTPEVTRQLPSAGG